MGLIQEFITWLYAKYVYVPAYREKYPEEFEIREEITITEDDPAWVVLKRERLFSELH